MEGMRGDAFVRSSGRSKELVGDVAARGRRVAGSKTRSSLLKYTRKLRNDSEQEGKKVYEN